MKKNYENQFNKTTTTDSMNSTKNHKTTNLYIPAKEGKCIILLSALLLSFPVLMLNLEHSANGIYLLLVITSIVCVIPGVSPLLHQKTISRPPWWLLSSFALYPVAILFQYAVKGQWNGNGFDAPSRFLLAIPLLWVLPLVPFKNTRFIYWSAFFGVWLAFIEAAYFLHTHSDARAMTYFTWPTMFGNLVLLLGTLSLGLYQGEKWRKFLALSGLIISGVSAYLSQTRASWFAFIVIVSIWISFRPQISRGRKFAAFSLLFLLLSSFYLGNNQIRNRIDDGLHEVFSPLNLVTETSSGQRRQMWGAAWEMSKEHPWLGIGRSQFQKEKLKKIQDGTLSPSVEPYDHPHNELLFGLVEMGVLGFLGILALYLGPAAYFWRYRHHDDSDIQTAAVIGLMLVGSYFTFGLLDVMMVAWVMQAPIYSLCIIIPYVLIMSKRTMLSRQLESR